MSDVKLDWVDTLGGPHLLISAELLHSWSGIDGWFDHLSLEDNSDYARACRVKNWIQLLETGDGNALVLSGDAGAISWIPNSDKNGGLLIQWIGADNDQQILNAIENGSVLGCLSDEKSERLTFNVNGSGLMYLIDSVDDGKNLNEPFLELKLAAGQHLVEAGYYEDANLMLVIRKLTRA